LYKSKKGDEGMNHKQNKLENPLRIEELNPKETLKRIGLQEKDVVCDIGAGSGIFTIPAAMMTGKTVYALEISAEMLSIIEDKMKQEALENIELVKVDNSHFDVEGHSIDLALMVTVLHEIEEKNVFLQEVKRLMKASGKIAVIEFHKRETPMGPPVSHRMGKEEVKETLHNIGFVVQNDLDLGDNYYCLVFGKKI
jgi:ubiquinone/menaquinone biosynthesis C-methylase UbiE